MQFILKSWSKKESDPYLTVFDYDLAKVIDLHLQPLSARLIVDPLSYLSGRLSRSMRTATQDFLQRLENSLERMEQHGVDPSKLTIFYRINYKSAKRIPSADIAVSFNNSRKEAPTFSERVLNPDISHPLRTTDVLERLEQEGIRLHSKYTNKNISLTLIDYSEVKKKNYLCWIVKFQKVPQYANDILSFIIRISPSEKRP